ncbi:MAG: ABC transporter substrate-binding protein [Candidatus Thiodiazotropha taylori]|nr:ABC transporter substrate-binding protein [Candidatus Thiodiazotropha taylori]MCG7917498.1 ABC transporter substrate-binding protein [Candidatus Thiodiazotropha taylori]MCG7923962.1 ABC transporter substrate-binding protein [Candidatus Thiodiazotropha taylori]MCG7933824.1 ABC transporter substrate-binding protein [Candidatus Thiodiazotropha taylori]MCG7969404.1 ABC transporter substrate-binding protein [Candidatus Thiodiazotropha taylori]
MKKNKKDESTMMSALLTILLLALIYLEPLHAEPQEIPIGLITEEQGDHIPLSLLQPVIEDIGEAGALQGIQDNNTTGRFTGQSFTLRVEKVEADKPVIEAFRKLHQQGIRLFLVNLPADKLLQIADETDAKTSLLFNIGATDDNLRQHDCRANLFHTIPSRAMLTDALAQYLAWKRWTEWFLVIGRHPRDKAYAEALKRAAKRFGHKIVEQKQWTFEPGARRTDSGHNREQQVVNEFSQVSDYDILIVADESNEFGEFLTYRTYRPRPVGGTQGLSPAAWSGVHEQWGATQFQRRFNEQHDRWMTDRDFSAWLAVRSIGEAATRTSSGEVNKLKSYMQGPEFNLAAFKGRPVSYRDWSNQLRQPLLITSAKLMISVSPQTGFLHQFTTLDTLGYDRPESRCKK